MERRGAGFRWRAIGALGLSVATASLAAFATLRFASVVSLVLSLLRLLFRRIALWRIVVPLRLGRRLMLGRRLRLWLWLLLR
jgi:ABC-type sulfate transport system permease component